MRSILFRNHLYITSFLWHRSGKSVPQASSDGVNSVTDEISKLDIDANVDSKTTPTAENKLVSGNKECKCGMPLCICEAPAPSSDAPPQQVIILIIFRYHFLMKSTNSWFLFFATEKIRSSYYSSIKS